VNEQGSLGLFEYEVIGHEINIFRGIIIYLLYTLGEKFKEAGNLLGKKSWQRGDL